MKKRSSELDLAETHYIAALKALTPPESRKTLEDIQEFQSPTSSTSEDEPNIFQEFQSPTTSEDEPNVLQEFQSPTSSTSEDEPNSFGRRPSSVSLNSQHSRASSETSYAEDDDFFADWEFQPSKTSQQFRHSSSQDAQDDYNPITKLAKRRPSPIITRPAPQSFHAEQFSADLYAFATMVQLHLASVRELKEAATTSTYRYSVSRLQSPTLPSRRGSRDLGLRGDPAGMENLRQGRKSMAFRARFDPSSVQELCQEVLSEL
jgi:hypothetical protein